MSGLHRDRRAGLGTKCVDGFHVRRRVLARRHPAPGARVIERPHHPDGNVALFRTDDNRVFAVLDRCPHKGGPLSQGIVYGERVACPLHNWSIELGSGCAVAPDVGCARTFPVNVERGIVFVALG